MMGSAPIIAACLWLIAGNIAAVLPSRDNHWRRAYVLIVLGFPILIWVALALGFWPAALFALAAASVLRWPLFYLGRLLRRVLGW